MAEQAEQIERRQDLHPAESRELIRSLIQARHVTGMIANNAGE